MGTQPVPDEKTVRDTVDRQENNSLHRLRIIVGAILVVITLCGVAWVATCSSKSTPDGKSETKIAFLGLQVTTCNAAVGFGGIGLVGLIVVMRSTRKITQDRRNVSKSEVIENNAPQDISSRQEAGNYGHKPSIQDLGYKVVNRSINCHFLTRTTCKTSHEIVVLATSKKGLSQYHGRHPVFENDEPMIVKPPHRLLQLGMQSDNWQNFTIRLEPSLAEGENTQISMHFEWTSKAYDEHPDVYMVPFCKTDSLRFVVSFAPGLQIAQPVGQVFAHAGSHEPIETTLLEIKDSIVTWGLIRNPVQFSHYRLSWKWTM
jgi:hypothetical protein